MGPRVLNKKNFSISFLYSFILIFVIYACQNAPQETHFPMCISLSCSWCPAFFPLHPWMSSNGILSISFLDFSYLTFVLFALKYPSQTSLLWHISFLHISPFPFASYTGKQEKPLDLILVLFIPHLCSPYVSKCPIQGLVSPTVHISFLFVHLCYSPCILNCQTREPAHLILAFSPLLLSLRQIMPNKNTCTPHTCPLTLLFSLCPRIQNKRTWIPSLLPRLLN